MIRTVMDAAIRTIGLTKHYGASVALVQLDLEVKKGEAHLPPQNLVKGLTFNQPVP